MTDNAFSVILVEPQLGENIGMCARAMWNCGIKDLRLVSPRDGWPSEAANKASSGADPVIEAARVYETTEDAVKDLDFVIATTARPRDMTKIVFTPEAAARDMRERVNAGQRTGVLFGKEAMGLSNDDVALSDAVLTVPLNPAFTSLNLAQAVLLMGYEWFKQGDDTAGKELKMPGDTRPAGKEEMINFFEHLEEELDARGFLRVPEKRPTMVRNIRNMFWRAEMTEQEVRTFRGILKALTKFPRNDGES